MEWRRSPVENGGKGVASAELGTALNGRVAGALLLSRIFISRYSTTNWKLAVCFRVPLVAVTTTL